MKTITYELIWDDKLEFLKPSVEFLQGEFGSASEEEQWTLSSMRWKLGPENPAGTGLMHVAVTNGRVIGTVSVTPKRVLIDGEETNAMEIGDTYSNAVLRRKAVSSKSNVFEPRMDHYFNKSIFGRCVSEISQRATRERGSLIYGTPNQNSLPGYVGRLGFEIAPGFPIRSASRMTVTGLVDMFKLPLPLAKLVCLVLCPIQKLHSFALQASLGLMQIKMKEGPPSTYDLEGLWMRAKPNTGFAMVRDAEYWQYRYLTNPLGDFRFFSFFKHQSLVGVVVTRKRVMGDGAVIVQVAEWMGNQQFSFIGALNQVIKETTDKTVVKINLWVNTRSPDFLAVLFNGFIPRAKVPVIFFKSPFADPPALKAANRGFFLASSDNV